MTILQAGPMAKDCASVAFLFEALVMDRNRARRIDPCAVPLPLDKVGYWDNAGRRQTLQACGYSTLHTLLLSVPASPPTSPLVPLFSTRMCHP